MVTYIKALFVSLMFTLPLTAQAQSRNCAPREGVLERLSGKYEEVVVARGIGQRGVLMETFASPSSGSWTVTVTLPNGLTCLVASGESFESIEIKEGDPT